MSSSFCDNILLHDNINVFGNGIGIAMIALSTIYLATSFLLLYFVKVQEYYAKRTDSKAVRIVIFPIYSYILWANAIVNLYVGMVGLYYTFQPFENSGDVVSAWAFAFMWGIQHMVVEGVPIMLMQKGLGTYAVKQSLKQSALWGVYTMFNTLAIYKTNTTGSFCFSMVWQTILLVYYFCLWALPQKRLFRRPAAINYAMFWCLFRVLSILATVLFFVRTTHSEGNCIYVIGTLFPYAILEPFVIYYTLLQDSKWWQGLDIMQGRRFSTVEEIRSPLAGIDLNLSSAQSLAASMDNMSLGAHSQGKAQVRLLNFAYITLDKTRQLGSGSFSKVYLGSYRKERCAIKMIFTLDLTQDVIRRVAAEAQILSMIKHKNIVSILGVSVLPPSVCILLELCVFGSLADVIKATGPLTGFVAHEHSQQQQSTGMSLSWPDRLYLAVGCVRGLNALHSYNNELCHRDIKSFNFLVDEHLNAKISDLELGITEDIHVTANASALARLKQKTSSFFGPKVSKFSVNSGSDAEQVSELGIGEGVLRADDFLANWSAPEVIKDGCHVQASDMYSFSLVLWEILTGLVPFSEIKRQDDIRYKVLSGDRPAMPLCVFEGAAQQKYYEHYTALITRGWQHEAALRPSASEMLSELECIWLGCCSSILHDTEVQPDLNEIYDDHRSRRQSRFSMWSTLTPSTANASAAAPSQIVTEQSVTRICDMMQGDQESFEAMDNHSGAWVIITHECPHVVLRCNAAFSSLTGVQLNDIIGLPLRDTFIFGEQTETVQTEEFLAGLRANRSTATHTVLTLYHSIVLAGTLKFQSPNLYSLHAFPIFKRSGGNNGSGSHPAPLEPELPVCTEVDGEADAASQLSAPVHSPVSMSSSLPNLSTMRALNISSTNLDAVSAAHSGNAPNQERAVSNDATVDALPVGSTAEVPSTLSRLSSSLLASRPSILQHRMSTTSNADQSVTSGTSGAAGQSSQTAGRSFFGFSGKRAKTASHQSLSNLMETSQQRAARPVAMVAVLFSKLKDLSPPKEQTTNRSSGIFRHNSSDNMSRLASQSKSNQNSESLASALMQERLSEV